MDAFKVVLTGRFKCIVQSNKDVCVRGGLLL